MNAAVFPEFQPHPLVRGGHAQTILGNYFRGPKYPYTAQRHRVVLEDGDAVILHDDCPPNWRAGGRAALLIHGLAGCHLSAYMIRIAARLKAAGVRAFRIDLRNCGAGQGLARSLYHAGRSRDALAALREISRLCPNSPIGIAGFSLGGNITLKLLGEEPDQLPGQLQRAVAVCPCVDLARCVDGLKRPGFGLYDAYFVRLLVKQVREARRKRPEIPAAEFARRLRRIVDFDDRYTARHCGFGTAQRYYSTCSAVQFLPDIRVPTVILASRDDPLIPVAIFETLTPSDTTRVHIAESGGHLGFLGRNGGDPDRRWMDWRVVEWLSASPLAVSRPPHKSGFEQNPAAARDTPTRRTSAR